jgi:hypothetical protein
MCLIVKVHVLEKGNLCFYYSGPVIVLTKCKMLEVTGAVERGVIGMDYYQPFQDNTLIKPQRLRSKFFRIHQLSDHLMVYSLSIDVK